MDKFENINEYHDQELEELLEVLYPVEARESEAVSGGRRKFEMEVDRLLEYQSRSVWDRFAGLFFAVPRSKQVQTRAPYQPKFAFSALLTVIVALVLVFGGASVTAYASQSALPGDALYSVKTSLEQTQVRLSRDAANRAQLYLDFSERRLDEIASLIEDGRFTDIGAATGEFESHVQRAIGELQTVAMGNPARAEELAGKITSALSRYANTLSGMLTSVPEAVKPDVERALETSRVVSSTDNRGEFEFSGVVESISGDVWKIGGRTVTIGTGAEIKGQIQVGDMVKVHATAASDGSLTVREIEFFVGERDAQESGNENENANENLNDNQSENVNEDSIEGEDGNENQNENVNDNEDVDLDENTNEGGNENENVNLNENEDGNTNEDENTNDDENENSGENDNQDNEDSDNENDADDDNENENENVNENENENENENSGD